MEMVSENLDLTSLSIPIKMRRLMGYETHVIFTTKIAPHQII